MEAILGAFVGAVTGSIGAVLVREWLLRRRQRAETRGHTSEHYLLQFQDAVETLWHRFDNLRTHHGSQSMERDYFKESTLFALGSVLAYRRILLIDGVFQRLNSVEEDCGTDLRESLRRFEADFHGGFRHYHRRALAEAVMERSGKEMRTRTFSDFRDRYEIPRVKLALDPAVTFIDSLTTDALGTAMDRLEELATLTSDCTGMPITFESEFADCRPMVDQH